MGPSDNNLRRILRYGAAFVSIGSALVLRLAIQPLVGDYGTYIIFLLGVVVTAWSGGFGPALVATGLGALFANWFFVPPIHRLTVQSAGQEFLLTLYVVTAVLISVIIRRLSKTRDLLGREIEERRHVEDDVRRFNAELERRVGERTEDLQKKAALLTEAERVSGLGSWERDVSRGEAVWSDEVYRIYGLSSDRFKPSYEAYMGLLLPEDRDRVRRLNDEACRTGRPFEFTHDILRPDGSRRTLHVRGRMVMGSDGVPIRMYGTTQDVTEQKELETRERSLTLKESLQRERARTAELEAVMETVPAAILITRDAEGRKIIGNAASYELLGMSPGENISKSGPETTPYEVYIDGRKAEASELPIQRSAATGRPVLGCELEIRRADGKSRWMFGNAVPIFGEDGQVSQVVAAFAEVTERKGAEEKIRTLNADLERRVRERTEELEGAMRDLESFSYTVAHDLRAPLRAMKGFAELVLDEAVERLGPQERDYLQRVVESAGRMDALVHDLLAYSRLGRVGAAIESVALDELIGEIVAQMSQELRDQRPEFIVERGIPDVLGHPESLRQVMTNLLSNAVKFVFPGASPHIRIAAQTRESWVRLTVEDNGIGIAPEYHERIFHVFERLHRPELYPGTGIGLAIVRRAIDKMGGRVGVDSQLGKGSRFWFELPLAARSAESKAPAKGNLPGSERRS